MIEKLLRLMLFLSVLFVVFAAMGQAKTQGKQAGTPAPPPAPRAIPGITAKDSFPRACVDCHVNYPEQKQDMRISTLMKQWNQKVDPKLVEKAAASARQGVRLKGKHPVVASALRDIPAGCLRCHGKASRMAPPFSGMLHTLHLTGGKDNPFLTLFQGECTHCHKLNATTGEWSLPSGPEK